MNVNPLLGTGFESFWLGDRPRLIQRTYELILNEAHNGYLEVFLNLGWIGVALLAIVFATGYRNIAMALRREPDTGSLRLAYFITAVAYNCTESAIRIMHPVWIFFLLATIAVPEGWSQAEAETETVRVPSPRRLGAPRPAYRGPAVA